MTENRFNFVSDHLAHMNESIFYVYGIRFSKIKWIKKNKYQMNDNLKECQGEDQTFSEMWSSSMTAG